MTPPCDPNALYSHTLITSKDSASARCTMWMPNPGAAVMSATSSSSFTIAAMASRSNLGGRVAMYVAKAVESP